jgi:chromosome segregation protein
MDTGVGAKAYSIIEQGQVAQLLQSSKVDRRAIFEEAAGISKYKAHKKEAMRKLERTEQNLLRLADILGEVEKQLRSVKHQAGKARSFLKYTERLKELQVNYSLVEYAKIDEATKEKNSALDDVQQRFATVAAQVAKNDAMVSELGGQIIETENQINQTDNSLVSVQSKIEQHLQRIEFLRTRIAELGERKQNAAERVEKVRQTKELYVKDLARCKAEQQQLAADLEQRNAELAELQAVINKAVSECAKIESELEDEKSGIIDIVRRTAQLHNELQSLNDYRTSLANQKDRLSGRADTARQQLEQLLTEKAQYETRAADVEKNITELTQSLEVQQKKAQQVGEHISADTKRLAHVKEARSAITSELSILTDMEGRFEGLAPAVKAIIEKRRSDGRFDYIEGLVADCISADAEYAAAVEACLEGRTDSVIVNSTEKLLGDNETINSLDGRVTFLCIDRVGQFYDSADLSRDENIKGRLVEFVKYDSKFAPLAWQLLGKTLLVDSVSSAMKLAGRFADKYQFVTAKGELVSFDGSVKLGPMGKTSGLISRKSRIRQLEEIIGNMEAEVTELEQQLGTAEQSKEHLAKLQSELRTAVYESNTERTEITSKISYYEKEIKRLREEQPLICGEIEMLEEQIAQSVKREYNSRQKLEELETVNNQRNERIKQLEEDCRNKQAQLQIQKENLTELRISLGRTEQQAKAVNETIQTLQKQLADSEGAEAGALEEIKSCGEQAEQAQNDILSCESQVSQFYVEKEQTQQSSRQLHGQIEELLEKQKETQELVRQERAEQTQVEAKISEIKIELGQLEVKQQDLTERVREELQIDLAQAFENFQNDQQVDWQAVREEINELRGKIDRLGNVNLDSITEQDDLEKRQEFLSGQVADLNSGKGQLQQLISRLNKMSREKFEQVFEEIRNNFQEIFRKLFGGGKADILLEESDDILEAGIEIMAKPPGKETRSISLLSGGEKSMTAIALLFAVFKTKPSPFCFLDEVDAALDEANNERFNMMIREFRKESQFVVITHAKRTMSIADVLYGITMQTKGVSKKISVQFDQYESPQEESAAVA